MKQIVARGISLFVLFSMMVSNLSGLGTYPMTAQVGCRVATV